MSDTEVLKNTKQQEPVEGVPTEQPVSKKEHELKKGHKKANVQKKKKQVEEEHVSEPEDAEKEHVSEPEDAEKEQQDQDQNQEGESEVSEQDTASEEETESEDEEDELVQKLTGLKVNKSYKVLDQDGNVVGKVVAGNRKKAVGRRVKENGSIIDSKGNFIASVAPVKPEEISGEADQAKDDEAEKSSKKEEEEEQQEEAQDGQEADKEEEQPAKEEEEALKEEEKATEEELPKEDEKDLEAEHEKSTAPVGDDAPTVNESGNIIDQSGNVVGTLKKGKAHELAGMSVDEEGNVVDEDGNILGKAELPPPEKTEEEKKAEVEEQEQHKIVDQMTTFIEQALNRIKPILKMITEHIETEERKPENERDEEKLGNAIRPLIEEGSNILGETNGAIHGLDPTGAVAKRAQDRAAERKASPEEYRLAELLSTLTGEVPKTIENAKKKIASMPQEQEQRKIADQMSAFIEQAINRIRPILKMITELIETEERKPEKERDEEKLVNAVRPLIEEGSTILGETNGAIRGLDPTGRIAKRAQARSAERKASPEEYRLAELLSTLTGEISKTIENAKKKIASMPHAKEELSPLWSLLQNPLLQIVAGVGLLLSGVLGLVGNILNGLGLGGLVNNLLGGLGLDKVLQGLGVGKLFGGKKKQ